MAEVSNVMLIKGYFFDKGESAGEIAREMRKLTKEEREQLGEAIRNGTLTY